MRDIVIWVVTATFVSLGMLHLYWASGGALGSGEAIPQTGGAAAFKPSAAATVAVALALFAAAAVVAAAGGKLLPALPHWMAAAAALVLAAILLLRAIGDFRFVGFFKRNHEGRFAELDTFLYSPLCLALALAIAAIVATRERSA